MYAGQRIISVRDCRCAVARFVQNVGGLSVECALNWEALEAEALLAIDAQGGAFTISGLYTCPASLADQARFQEEEK